MRLLVVVDCYRPGRKSVAQLVHELACELAAQEHEVTVLAPAEPEGPDPGVAIEDGIRVIRFAAGRTKGVHFAVRAINEMSISLVAWWQTRAAFSNERFDGIVFYSPSIFFGPLVRHLKRRWDCRTYLILRDIFPDWAVDAGLMRKGLAYRLFKWFERLQYSVADVIGVETSRSMDYFEGTRFEHRTELLRNWTRSERPRAGRTSLRAELDLDAKVVFFFGGNLGVAQDMDNVVRLARRMAPHPEAHFLLVGEGSERQRLTELVERDGMSNMTVLGPVDSDVYMSILVEFDVGLITLDRRLKTFSNTGKLLGYLRCGLPVLASYNDGNDLEELLRDSGAGLGSVNGEDDQFYAHAVRLCDPAERRVMGANARELLAKHFAVEAIASQIVRAMNQYGTPTNGAVVADHDQGSLP